MRWSFTLSDNYTFFCISILFIIPFYILQFEASEHQLVFIKFGIGKVVLRDIKTVTAYETHFVEVLVSRELGFTDDVEILIEHYDRKLTGFGWNRETRKNVLGSHQTCRNQPVSHWWHEWTQFLWNFCREPWQMNIYTALTFEEKGHRLFKKDGGV